MGRLRRAVYRLGTPLFASMPVLQRAWFRRHGVVNAEAPWAGPARLGKARVALVTTAGVHLADDVPFDVDAPAGDATFRRIPAGVDRTRLRISHLHYDTRDAERDINVVLPLDRLDELAATGRIASVAPTHYSFGWVKDPQEVVRETAPALARELIAAGVGAVVLTPA
jgi:D-proline reductase (dithiol) PrdB